MADSIFPDRVKAGLSQAFRVVSRDCPAPDWTVTAVLRGPAAIDLVAQPEGRNHVFHVPAAVSAQWLAGRYVYSVRAARDGHVVELEHGELQVAADIAQLAAGHDPRAHVQKVLDAIEAVLENRATLEQEQYQINNRSLKRRSIGELLKLRDHYRAELSRMNAARRGRLFGNINVAFR